MFNEITIDLWFFWNFAYMKKIIRTCNLTVRFSKFTLNIEIYEEFIEFLSKLVWRKTLFYIYIYIKNPKITPKKKKSVWCLIITVCGPPNCQLLCCESVSPGFASDQACNLCYLTISPFSLPLLLCCSML